MADFTAATAVVEGLAVVVAMNAPRVWSALPARPSRLPAAVLGAGITVAAALALAALADPLLDFLDVSASTFRLGAGLVLAIVGAYDLFAAPPKPEPSLPGWRAGIVPLAFPLLVNPALGAGALMAAADHGVAIPVAAALIGGAVFVGVALLSADHDRVLRGVGRVVAAALVIIGIALAADGVFSL